MPKAQIQTAVERLRPILAAIQSGEDQTMRSVVEGKEVVYERFQPLFRSESIDSMPEDEFRAFLIFENNHHWPLHRMSSALCADMDRLRRALAVLIDESRPIRDRLNEVRDKKGDLYIPGLGKGVITAILHVAYPESYAVWNNQTERAMKGLKIWPSGNRSAPFGDQYVPINEIAHEVARELGTDLWTLDALWWKYEDEPQYDDAADDGDLIRDREAKSTPPIVEPYEKEAETAEVEAVAQDVARWFPDAEFRKRILALLANTVEQAAKIGARRWCLSHRDACLTLSVGRIMTLRIGSSEVRVALAAELLTPEQRSKVEELGEWGREFRSAAGVHVGVFAPENFVPCFPHLETAIEEAIRVGGQIQQTPYFNSHSPATLTYLERELGRKLPRPSYETPYWKISPGRGARLWNDWLEGGFAAIGWPELGDLIDVDDEEFQRRAAKAAEHAEYYQGAGVQQVKTFAEIPEGAYLVANRGTTEVLGIGRVTGGYEFVAGDGHPHRLPVDWFDTEVRQVNQPGWRRTLIALDRRTFEAIRTGDGPGPDPIEGGFSEETFDLLDALRENPTRAFYMEHQTEFQAHVEQPVKDLLIAVREKLPVEARELLETEKNVFSRIPKNDYGRGGAWDFYWGAFYPKGQKRIAGAQLFVWLGREYLHYGFYIGEKAEGLRQRIRELLGTGDPAQEELERTLEGRSLLFAEHEGAERGEGWGTLEEWLAYAPVEQPLQVRRILTKDEVLAKPFEELVDEIAEAFGLLFPFVLLATQENSWDAVSRFLDVQPSPAPTQPRYMVEDLRTDTGFDQEQIQQWMRRLRRKRHVILQGPPGTGKTYVAQRLARLMVSGGTGFWQILQFHPAYAYEDFMQGIRPLARDGALSYELELGHFLRFCQEAERREDACVLIIDEINRANLARVFGELMFLLEYRDAEAPLAGGGKPLRVPENVYVIGTMNTADRSITRMDHAMRRRFAFIRLRPEYEILRQRLAAAGLPADSLVDSLKRVNEAIDDPNFEVGISYFLHDTERLKDHIRDIWMGEIEPYLEEYFYDQPRKLQPLRWGDLAASGLKDWV